MLRRPRFVAAPEQRSDRRSLSSRPALRHAAHHYELARRCGCSGRLRCHDDGNTRRSANMYSMGGSRTTTMNSEQRPRPQMDRRRSHQPPRHRVREATMEAPFAAQLTAHRRFYARWLWIRSRPHRQVTIGTGIDGACAPLLTRAGEFIDRLPIHSADDRYTTVHGTTADHAQPDSAVAAFAYDGDQNVDAIAAPRSRSRFLR